MPVASTIPLLIWMSCSSLAAVFAAVVGAVVLPANGKSVLVLAVLAACYLAVAVAFAAVSRGLDLDAGTESLRVSPTEPEDVAA